MAHLEHLHKLCSAHLWPWRVAVFLAFGIVSAQLQVAADMRLRQSLAKKPKILALHRYIISVNALKAKGVGVGFGFENPPVPQYLR